MLSNIVTQLFSYTIYGKETTSYIYNTMSKAAHPSWFFTAAKSSMPKYVYLLCFCEEAHSCQCPLKVMGTGGKSVFRSIQVN